ncbi:type II secretion system protein [Coraliomargarita parva]|uniref:type II secretion system protein n=1 Tax=Coraliomargarita parva TaxID=3014050 RepID=UPI0022B5B987|nr:type II secretion system protein [Coraliomargarita parva]
MDQSSYVIVPSFHSSRSKSTLELQAGNACRAFTLIELLAVIAIVGVLTAILIPAISAVRKNARDAVCLSNLRQLHSGVLLYAGNQGGWLPTNSADDAEGGAWWKHIYPEIIDSADVFWCPEDDTGGISDANAEIAGNGKLSYGAVGDDAGMENGEAKSRGVMGKNLASFKNPARSVMLVDDHKSGRQLAKSWFFNWPKEIEDLNAAHDGKINMVFVDGHVDSLSYDEIQELFEEDRITVSYGGMNSKTPSAD